MFSKPNKEIAHYRWKGIAVEGAQRGDRVVFKSSLTRFNIQNDTESLWIVKVEKEKQLIESVKKGVAGALASRDLKAMWQLLTGGSKSRHH